MIRSARLSDAQALYVINRDSLGYDSDMSATKAQLERLLQDSKHTILVAEENGHVVGYVHAHLYETLYFKPLWNLMALAVSQDYQGKGFGAALLSKLEKLAQQSNISGISRRGAHAFYKELGYVERPEQKRFIKNWDKC
ncbi:GNAT family N-acetyltransferase [Streptococcus orisratti]